MKLLHRFFSSEASGGVILIIAAAAAMLLANMGMTRDLYHAFLETPVELKVGALEINKNMLLWINDALMALFFLLVALEIKREMVVGQLRTRAQLMLPLVCAISGMAVPAAIYAGFNFGDIEAIHGWAIPSATDIAFALGILALLGSRVPLGMKLLLSTIAVIDDLAAIIIIALFYTSDLSMVALAWAGAAIAAMVVLNRRGVQALTPYLLLGTVVWVAVLKSGVHATLAGVVTGLLIPHVDRKDGIDDETQHSPLETLEHALHPWVAYAILPVFAFANAGLALAGLGLSELLSPLPAGIALGLVLGKPIGIVLTALGMRAAGFARFPEGMDLRAMVGLGILCGIGFTMSLFIGGLAFAQSPLHYTEGVVGVLGGSLVAAVIGLAWLHAVLPKTPAR